MKEPITIREWIANYNKGFYDSPSFRTQCEAGWYDWFCKDTSLANRLKKMAKTICKIINPFILDNYYVWFKNNCPCVGPLYDDFRFEPLNEEKRDELYFGIAIDDKREESKYNLFSGRADYKIEANFTNAREVVKYINNWPNN